jgi:NADH-ubiquinone oxidoreductase chain 5
MSQLGMMMIAIGISSYNTSIYHLLCHAMFKALLFMSAGSIIHSVVYESQDIRYYGGYIHYLPITYIAMVIASFALIAIPGMSGYYSKDFIIESLYGHYTISGYIIYIFSVLSATLTTIYSTRLLYMVFYNTPNSNKFTYHNIHESGAKMLTPMIALVIFSIFIGYMTKDIYLGMGSPLHSLYIHPDNISLVDTEFAVPSMIKILPLGLVITSIILVLYIYEYYYTLLYIYMNRTLYTLYLHCNNKYMIDQLLNNVVFSYGLYTSISLYNYLDKGLLHIFGPTGLARLGNLLSYSTISLSTQSHYRHNTIYILLYSILLLVYCVMIYVLPINYHYEYIVLYIIVLYILPYSTTSNT